MRRSLLLLIALIIFTVCGAETLTFKQPSIEYRDGYAWVRMPGAAGWGQEGEPLLPAVGYRQIMPWGEKAVNIVVDRGEPVRIPLEAPVLPAQRKYPLSQLADMQPAFTQPNDEIYSEAQWPVTDFAALKTSTFRGYDIAGAVVFPVVYLPAEQALLYYPEMDVRIETETALRSSSDDAMVRSDAATMRKLADMAPNIETAYTYPASATRTRNIAEYFIITDEDFVEEFQPLADYKTDLGIVTSIVTVQSILADYPGSDQQMKIRNFIIDAYQNNGLNYVLLAGDDEIIPHRGFLVDIGYGQGDDDVGSDLYYFGLDGTWNDDGDTYWGEWSEADFVADVYGGRAAVDSEAEATTFVTKQMMYQQSPVEEDLTENMLIGEDLGWISWGMDFMEEIRIGGTHNGYTTVGIPDHINVETLYDHEGVWTIQQLFSMLNEGRNLVGHVGHCNTHYNIKFETSDVNTTNITNDGVDENFYIVYTQGCYCNAFDNRDTNGNYMVEDCISEQWMLLPTGAVCYIGNTRYGWGDNQGTDGPSQHMHREFYDALYGEGITIISEAHEQSRIDTQPFLTPDSTILWAFYECTLMGDPTLDVWTNQPQQITIDAPGILPVGASEIQVAVSCADAEVEGMRVSALYGGDVLDTDYLDASGQATLDFLNLPAPGELVVVVSGHNIYDSQEIVQVISPNNAFMIADTITMTDGGDDMAAWNETMTLDLVAGNVGQQPASGVTATLSTESEYVSLLTDVLEFGDIGAESTAACDSGFVFTTTDDYPDEEVVEFSITFATGEESWSYNYRCTLYAPLFTLEGDTWNEVGGNGNGAVDPGETLEPLMLLVNNSAVAVEDVRLTVTCDNPYVTIEPETVFWDNIDPGGVMSLNELTVTVDEDIDPMAVIHFYLHIESDREYSVDRIASVAIEPMADSFEADACIDIWSHYVLTGSVEQWHRSSAKNHTVGGAWSWKCGSSSAGDYADNMYGALESTSFAVLDNTSLSFWHWMDAEDSSNYPGYAYDGGFVEISNDGGDNWQQIEPSEGYPYLSRGSSSPLNENTPLWSGEFDWTQAWFDLSDFAGDECMVRFVFASDSGEHEIGWFVDDVRVEYERDVAPPEDLSADYTSPICTLSWSGPNCPVDYYIVRRDGAVVGECVTANSFDDDLSDVSTTEVTYTVATSLGGIVSDFSAPYVADLSAVGGEVPGLVTALCGNHPNPFNPETTIEFSIATPANVELKVYNVRGQLVRTLVNNRLESGEHSVLWHGEDNAGHAVASGLYFVRMKSGDSQFARKMLLLK